MQSTPGSQRRSSQRLRGGDNDEIRFAATALACSICCIFLICNFFIASLDPNMYGIMRNTLTGSVDVEVFRGGIHLVSPVKSFIQFPAAQQRLQFSDRYPHGIDQLLPGDKPAINARTGAPRTGADNSTSPGVDTDSGSEGGGQEIQISAAFQYEFNQEHLQHVYMNYVSFEGARARYLQRSQADIIIVCQEYPPQAFWEEREKVVAAMKERISKSLSEMGAIVTQFFLLKVAFAQSYETSINSVQVATQQAVVNKYEQRVMLVSQSINKMKSAIDAQIANIAAGAQAKAKQMVATANRDAFNKKQGAKAKLYKALKEKLGFKNKQLSEYFKIKAVQDQTSKGKVVAGVPHVGN